MSEGHAARLLVVEDEVHIAAGLKLNFEIDGYEVDVVGSGREAAHRLVSSTPYDVIILDVMLPDTDGYQLCRSLRDAGDFTPVLILTARGTTEDRVAGLESGADDYLVKPFQLEELLARVRSMLRRRHWERETPEIRLARAQIGDCSVDFDAHEVRKDGAVVRLTQLEFALLHYFVANPGRILSRTELQERVWKLDYPSTRMVDNFMLRLRRLLEPDPTQPRYFVSVRGSGYVFDPSGGSRASGAR